MGAAVAGRRVPHVTVVGSDIEVAADDHVVARVGGGLEVATQPVQPRQLVLVERVVEGPTVGHVDRRDPDAATGGGESPGLGVGLDPGGEAVDHVVHPAAAEDGDAVPTTFAVVHRLVPEGRERQRREGVVGEFGLLQAQHVGRDVG